MQPTQEQKTKTVFFENCNTESKTHLSI